MADQPNYAKLTAFMDNLCDRENWTEAERAHLYRSEDVRYYAVNVRMLETMSAREYFDEDAKRLERILAAAAAVEAEAQAAQAQTDELAALKQQVADLSATVAELSKPKAADKPEEKPSGTPEPAPEA